MTFFTYWLTFEKIKSFYKAFLSFFVLSISTLTPKQTNAWPNWKSQISPNTATCITSHYSTGWLQYHVMVSPPHSSHRPAVTRTLSTASVSLAPRARGPRARSISRKSRSTFLKVTWARTQVLRSGLSCSIATLPGLPRYGHASTVSWLELPSALIFQLYRNLQQKKKPINHTWGILFESEI